MRTLSAARLKLRTSRRARPSGYTLIEILLVMGIIIMIITLVLISVNSMLKSSKMSRAVSLVVAAIDEARTAAITIRRTTRVDVTLLDDGGKNSRMTVFGSGVSDNFEEYKLPDPTAAGSTTNPIQDPDLINKWKSLGQQPQLVADGSRCMKARGLTSPSVYWCPDLRVDALSLGDYYESVLFARIKILPGTQRKDNRTMTVGLLGSIDDGGGGSIKSAYRLTLTITPAGNTGRNASSSVALQRATGTSGSNLSSSTSNGNQDGPATVPFDIIQGTTSPTAILVEGVWYRVLLSVKSYTPQDTGATPKAIVAGKIWADGQLEPTTYTVGPVTDTGSPLSNGFGGFSVDGCDALIDDVLFDMRPIRLIPQGITYTPLDPDQAYAAAAQNSKYSFPLMFRPDGTTSVFSIIEIADSTTGDKRYVRIDQNTGRARVKSTRAEVEK